jgi:hypothetical protein
MDSDKCSALKSQLASAPEPLVPVDRFFDGNDDLGSIGCNLSEHPGIELFRDILVGLTGRPDVEAAYAQIAEIDPGEDSWPFTDTVLVVGSIDPSTIKELVAPLQPDEVGLTAGSVPSVIAKKHAGRVLVIWWD